MQRGAFVIGNVPKTSIHRPQLTTRLVLPRFIPRSRLESFRTGPLLPPGRGTTAGEA
jgi:hypothetical protein